MQSRYFHAASFARRTQFPPTALHVARVFYLRPAAVKMEMPRETYFSINQRLQSDRLGWHTSRAHLKWRSSLHWVYLLLQHVRFTDTCQLLHTFSHTCVISHAGGNRWTTSLARDGSCTSSSTSTAEGRGSKHQEATGSAIALLNT